MRFPDYVPKAVQDYITGLLEGRDGESGLLEQEALFDRKLAELRACGKSARWFALLCAETKRKKEWLLRLAKDPRMREVYTLLAKQDDDAAAKRKDAKVLRFVACAFGAQADFATKREHRKHALKLLEEIAHLADKLQPKLRELVDLETSAAVNLLKVHEVITRAFPARPAPDGRASPVNEEKPRFAVDEDDIGFNMIDLLEALKICASTLKAEPFLERDRVAIASRKRNAKFDYLRAFCASLAKDGFKPSGPILRAVALTATVLVNEPNVDVSEDDARKAWQRAQRLSG